MFHVSVERPAHHQRLEENDTPRPLSSHPVTNSRLRGQSEAGAEIPDIPLRRRPETAQMAGPWEDDTAHWAPHGGPAHKDPELASTIRAHDHFKMDNSATNGSHFSPRGRVRSPERANQNRSSRGAHSWSPVRSALTRSTRSRANSTLSSYETNATSLLPLQTKGAEDDEHLEPIAAEEIEPGSFDLVVPDNGINRQHSLETRSEMLFSKEHLAAIFKDFSLLRQFTDFLATTRQESLPLLTYYLDSVKAIRAIKYANAITASLEHMSGHSFTSQSPAVTGNADLEAKAEAAFEALAREDLPAYVTHVWTQSVSMSIKRRITGTLPIQLREMSEGLAEVFCLTDPSRRDNPIVFASEEFYKTTQYGMNYVIGRNCRFLQGPKTNPFSVKRIREKLAAGKEHYETFLNYRRDGSPFMNLLMMAPLYDSRGTVRYFIGAQVDVSGLVKEASGLDGFKQLIADREMAAETEAFATNHDHPEYQQAPQSGHPDEIRELSEMFNAAELESIRTHGGDMYRIKQDDPSQGRDGINAAAASARNWNRPRILIQDESWSTKSQPPSPTFSSGRLAGVYTHYLLVRPYPSLRILFASPSLRVPGILQSPFLSKIGGSDRVREGLTQALAGGQGVTAKICWLAKGGAGSAEGRARWIHCTPLLGSNGAVGVWMVVLVDDDVEGSRPKAPQAPPVNFSTRGPRREPHQDQDDNLSLSGFATMNRAQEGVDRPSTAQSRPVSQQTWRS